MPNHTATYDIETTIVDREFDYSSSSKRSIKFEAPNTNQALDLALKHANKTKSSTQTVVLESLVSDDPSLKDPLSK